jgi:hypothetical protein
VVPDQGAKVSTATAAPDVTFLTPLSHLHGQSDIAKMREMEIVYAINLVCGFTNQGVKVNIATVTFLATAKTSEYNAKLSLIKCQ